MNFDGLLAPQDNVIKIMTNSMNPYCMMNNTVADRPELSINTSYTNIEGKYLS